MNQRNHKNILRSLIAFSLIIVLAGLMDSCKAKEKCPAYGNAQPVKDSPAKNS